MQLRSLARNLRHMWLSSLIIFVIASVVIGAVHFATSKPSYQVEGDVVFTSKAFPTFETPDAAATYTTSLVTSYSTYIKSTSVMHKVGDSVSPAIPASTLKQALVVTPSPMMVSLQFVDNDEDRATAVVKGMLAELKTSMDNSTPMVKGEPAISIASSSVVTVQVPGSGKSVGHSSAIGLICGLIIALLVWFLRALISTKVRDIADIAEVTDSSVIGVLPKDRDAEMETVLGRNISFIPQREGIRTVLLAPSLASEHAATAALHAADSLARGGESVVLVDADLHRREASEQAGALTGPGLSDVLSGRTSVDKALHTRDGAPILSAGTAVGNGAELLATDSFTDLLNDLGSRYETVIVTGAPILTSADAAVVAPRVSSVVPVVGATKVRRSQLQQALELLELCQASVGGLVLTNAKTSTRTREVVGA